MKQLRWGLAALLSGVFCLAWADGGGTIYRKGVAVPMVGAYAYAAPDLFDPSKQAVVVVLSSEPIDQAGYDATEDRAKALDSLSWDTESKATSVQLTISTGTEARVEQVNLAVLAGEGLHSSGSMGKDFYKLDLKTNDGKRIEGSFRSTHESEKTEEHGAYYDVHFSLNVASGPGFGPGLPADGGEPFKGFRAYERALSHAWVFLDKSSLTGLANTLTEARLKIMNQSIKGAKGDEDKIKAILNGMHAEMPDSYRFVAGTVKGDIATMQLKGKAHDAAGDTIPDVVVAIVVTMKKENGDWCFDHSQKSGAADSRPAPGASTRKTAGK